MNLNSVFKSVVIPAFILMTGCAGITSQPHDGVPVEDLGKAVPEQHPDRSIGESRTGEDIMRIEELDSPEVSNRNEAVPGRSAVLALLDSADQEKQVGQMDHAAATLERALRLEPKNALLWSRLAEIRLLEKNWQQAYVLANKSNSLAQGNRSLRRQNWQIIEQAKFALGDMDAVEQARSRIRALSAPNS
jgi:tetratricopeptide (TPR) repeat protein